MQSVLKIVKMCLFYISHSKIKELMKRTYILKYAFNCANLKYECDVSGVIPIFLTERLVSVNVEIVCEPAAIV